MMRLSFFLFGMFLSTPCLFGEEGDPLEALKREIVGGYAKLACQIYDDSVKAAERLQSAVNAFVAAPSDAGLAKAKEAWTAARAVYLQSEAFRYYAGPIDDDDGPEPAINGWPLDENYIDAADGTGILQQDKRFPKLTPEVIEDLNQRDGEKNLSCGFHAIEFLLWGKDTSKEGPGKRPLTDFTTAPFARRRGDYLTACAKLLVRDLKYVADDWAAGKLGNYRAIFEEGWDVSTQRIATGMIFLGEFEVAGQRLQVAYDTQEQEEEHSCFSDTTHLDMVADVQGIANIWNGEYQGPEGAKLTVTGFGKLVQSLDPAMAAKIKSQIDASLVAAKAIPPPFDQAILGPYNAPGRLAIHKLILALEDQSLSLRAVSKRLGCDLSETPDVTSE